MTSYHSTQEDAAHYSSVPFLNGPFQSLRDGLELWILLAVSFAVYLLTLQPWAFPGDSANLAAAITGVVPDTSPMHFLWKSLMKVVAGSGAGMVFRMNAACAVFGALAVFLCYRVVLRLLTLAIDPTQVGKLPAARYEEGVAIAARTCRLGATASALALAFCVPFWISSTRVHYHPFYLCWLLLCAQLLLTFSRTRNLLWAVLWGFLHAVGMTQTSAFIDFFPFLLAYFLYVLWADSRIRPVRALVATGFAGIAGLGVLLLGASAFYHGEGCALAGGYTSVLNCANRMASALLHGTRGNLSQAPWLILIGLSVAPCLAALIAARRALNGENTWSFLVLHAVIAAIVLLDVLDFKASPWRFLGTGNTTLVPYLLIAVTYGYAAAYLHLLPCNLWASAESTRLQRFGRSLGAVAAVAFLAVPVYAAVANHRETGRRHARVFSLYADRLLDSLEGRSWMITDGAFDNLLLLRARERGMDVHCINSTTRSLRIARDRFTDVSLRNASKLGLQSLIQEWLAKESVTEELALVRFPDFWGIGGLEMLPHELVFHGTTRDGLKAIDLEKTIAGHEALWGEMKPVFDEISESARGEDDVRKLPADAPSLVIVAYRDIVLRPQLSFVGNNLGFALSMLSRDESLPADRRKALRDASYDIYRKVHEFDPSNISATLNWATRVFDQEPEAKQAEAKEALNEINRKLDANLTTTMRVWSLSRHFGYVEDPAFFAILGWTWANTGQPNLAMQALSAAESGMPEHAKIRMKSDIARLHLASARPDESEKLYFEMLVEDPGNREALMGLVHICAFRGDTQKAREFLDRAKQAGEPIASRQIASAIIYSVEGDAIRARSILQDLVDTDPQNVTAWSMLCSILFDQKDSAAMAEAVKTLESRAGVDAYQTLIARAMFAEMGGSGSDSAGDVSSDVELRNRLGEARDYYVRALRTRPGNIPLLNKILSLDFQVADKPSAREHAMQILQLNRTAPFANYILGSIAIDSADYKGAEDYLRRSVEAEPTIASLNDLADVLFHLDQFDEAELRVQQAFKMAGADKSYELWDTQGILQTARGRYDEAEASLQCALSLFGDDLRVHLHLADLYQRQGKASLAAESIRTIARQADSLPRTDRKLFEELHLKVLGVRFSKSNYTR